jgi:hypothetical protein
VDAPAETHEEHAREEGVEHAGEADVEFRAVDGPAADDVAVAAKDGVLDEEGGGGEDEDGEGFAGELAEAEGVEDVGDVLEEERPGGAVEGVHLLPAADVERDRQGDEGTADQHDQEHLPDGGDGDEGEHRGVLGVEEGCADEGSHDHHGLETDEAALVEVPLGHAVPAVVVGVGDDEAGEEEEEIDGEIAVVDDLLEAVVVGVGFEGVEDDDHDGGDTAEAVEDLVVGLGAEDWGGAGSSVHCGEQST